MLDVRPARNAVTIFSKLNSAFDWSLDNYNNQRGLHGRRALDVHQFLFRFDRPFVWPAAGLNLERGTLNREALNLQPLN
jgi:hypothetical protein